MTEFETAFDFVKEYSSSVAVAVRRNERVDDWTAHREYCDARGLEPTPERLALARDIAIAAREYFAGPSDDGGLLIEDAGADPGDLDLVPMLFLSDTLECQGWRIEFLNRDVRA